MSCFLFPFSGSCDVSCPFQLRSQSKEGEAAGTRSSGDSGPGTGYWLLSLHMLGAGHDYLLIDGSVNWDLELGLIITLRSALEKLNINTVCGG